MSTILRNNDYRLLYHVHNHPGGPINPSTGDVTTAGVLFGRKKVAAPLETYFNGKYNRYDHNSVFDTLEEVILTAPPKKKKN